MAPTILPQPSRIDAAVGINVLQTDTHNTHIKSTVASWHHLLSNNSISICFKSELIHWHLLATVFMLLTHTLPYYLKLCVAHEPQLYSSAAF